MSASALLAALGAAPSVRATAAPGLGGAREGASGFSALLSLSQDSGVPADAPLTDLAASRSPTSRATPKGETAGDREDGALQTGPSDAAVSQALAGFASGKTGAPVAVPPASAEIDTEGAPDPTPGKPSPGAGSTPSVQANLAADAAASAVAEPSSEPPDRTASAPPLSGAVVGAGLSISRPSPALAIPPAPVVAAAPADPLTDAAPLDGTASAPVLNGAVVETGLSISRPPTLSAPPAPVVTAAAAPPSTVAAPTILSPGRSSAVPPPTGTPARLTGEQFSAGPAVAPQAARTSPVNASVGTSSGPASMVASAASGRSRGAVQAPTSLPGLLEGTPPPGKARGQTVATPTVVTGAETPALAAAGSSTSVARIAGATGEGAAPVPTPLLRGERGPPVSASRSGAGPTTPAALVRPAALSPETAVPLVSVSADQAAPTATPSATVPLADPSGASSPGVIQKPAQTSLTTSNSPSEPSQTTVAGSTSSTAATPAAATAGTVATPATTMPAFVLREGAPDLPPEVAGLESAREGPTVELTERVAASSASAAAGMAASLSRASVETTALLAARMLNRLDQRVTRFDMALTPEGLGRVDVSMDIDQDGQLVARLAFDNPTAATEMRGRADELRRQLETAGFSLAEDALEFSERREGHASPFEDRRSGAGRAFRDGDRLAAEADLAPAVWVSLKPTSGGVDVKV